MPQHLQDQFEIQQLLYRYADAADRRDGEAYCACFCNGQVQISGPGYELDDGHQLIGLLRERFEWTMHNVHNHLYRIEGERAEGFTYCVASHLLSDQSQRLDMYIRYEDVLQRSRDGWRFISRRLHVGYQHFIDMSE